MKKHLLCEVEVPAGEASPDRPGNSLNKPGHTNQES
jgi:hypothetical protein